MSTQQHETTRPPQEPEARWLRYGTAQARYGFGRSFLAKKAREGALHPSRVSRRLTLWDSHELEDLITSARGKVAA